jgi:murein DD-endopeptidase MepM/ murein hydrolase activator NlpD
MLRRVVPALTFLLVAGVAPCALASDGMTAPETLTQQEASDRASLAAELGLDLDAGESAKVLEVSAPPAPCPARDPENGRCYASADAADLAWLSRHSHPSRPSRNSRPVAANVEEEDEEEGLEATETSEAPETPRTPGFWRALGDRIRSLVVRRSDSRPVAIPEEEIAALFSTTFPIPVAAYDPARLRDTFLSKRGKAKKHHAIDLGAPRGTPVVAVANGVIERLGRDRRGGKVVYLRDTTGRYTFYYAHLRVHETGLKAGDRVSKGQRLGEVGATGRVVGGPHLHFAIYRNEAVTDSRLFAVNPYLIFSTILLR